MATKHVYDSTHPNAQCPSALVMLEFLDTHSIASAFNMELVIKSYGLQCSTKLAHPRAFMLSKKSPKGLLDAAIKEAQVLYGSDFKKSEALVTKQAVYLLCGRDKAGKVKETCQTWRNNLIDRALEPKVSNKASKKQAAENAA